MAAGSDRFKVAADDVGLVSRSGSVLVSELAARLGLERELSCRLRHLFRRRPVHDPGRVVVDLATMLLDGGDSVSDLGALAEQPDLFGQVASHSTASRLLHGLGEEERAAIRSARRLARERAWSLGACPETITLDFDAQLLECHTEKEGGGPHRKGGFGFYPLHFFLDERASIWRTAAAGQRWLQHRRRLHHGAGAGARDRVEPVAVALAVRQRRVARAFRRA